MDQAILSDVRHPSDELHAVEERDGAVAFGDILSKQQLRQIAPQSSPVSESRSLPQLRDLMRHLQLGYSSADLPKTKLKTKPFSI